MDIGDVGRQEYGPGMGAGLHALQRMYSGITSSYCTIPIDQNRTYVTKNANITINHYHRYLHNSLPANKVCLQTTSSALT